MTCKSIISIFHSFFNAAEFPKIPSPKPARIPPQTPPAGGKFSRGFAKSFPPDKLFRPAESALIIWILLEIVSNFVQNIPPENEIGFGCKNMVGTKCRLF